MPLLILALALLLLPLTPERAQACGADENCELGNDRHYRIRMPEGHDGKTKIGAIVYAHGYRGSAAAAMRNQNLAKAISDLGVALIAVKSFREDWSLPNAPSEPKPEELVELDYFEAVIDDVTSRFAIDPERLMMTGFSAGGMMTWTLACERSELFAGFAPMAGTFWAPTPESCTSPATHVLHTHGTADAVVPIEGRPIRNTRQGNVETVMAMYADYGNYSKARTYKTLDLECTRRKNPEGKVLEICLHSGGHQFKTQYITRAWAELEKLGAL